MSDGVLYVIINLVVIFLYTVIIAIGLFRAYKENNRCSGYEYFIELKNIVEEIKNMVAKEDKFTKVNNMSLSDLINRKPTDKEYDEILDLLTELIRNTYKNYKFLIAKAQKDDEPHFLQIVSKYEDYPELHDKIFKKAIDYGVEMRVLQEKFAERVANGEVLDLGDDVVVIVDDGDYSLPTGISQINSGIEGAEITAIITFIREDNFQDWYEHHLKGKEKSE